MHTGLKGASAMLCRVWHCLQPQLPEATFAVAMLQRPGKDSGYNAHKRLPMPEQQTPHHKTNLAPILKASSDTAIWLISSHAKGVTAPTVTYVFER